MKTNLFIVGAAKCATTSFHDYLGQHPDVCMSSIKEPNYFSHEEIKKDNLYYLGANLIDNLEDYNSLFETNSSYKIFGESSVSYISYPKTAEKIKNYNPDAKIIIFLRNPVERTFSHYLMDYTAGYFNAKLEDIIENYDTTNAVYKQIIGLSFYSNQLQNYFEYFDKNQIKVIIYEDFITDIKKFMHEIEAFVGIEQYENYSFPKENSYRGSQNKILNVFYRSVKLKQKLKKVIPKNITRNLKNSMLKAEKPTIKLEDKQKLESKLYNDVRNIEKLLNINLSEKWF
jgi:hypothetical protein